MNNLLHGAESFFSSYSFLSWSLNSLRFVELEGSLPCSQEPTTCPYPKPDESSVSLLILFLEDPF